MPNGIDVSQWQGDIDFNAVKRSGVDFVIIRAGYGMFASQVDPKFNTNYKRAKDAGLDVGVYWYSYAKSVSEAIFEADTCINAIKGKTFEYPIYFDLEETSQFNKGKGFCDAITCAFCTRLEKAGYFAGLYISRSPLQTYISVDVANRYALWVAEYGSKLNYNKPVGIWQYSSKGVKPGINGEVDLDISYVDYPTIIKSKGLNGFPKSINGSKKFLDTTGAKLGDSNSTVYAFKCMLHLAYLAGLISVKLDDNSVYGKGTLKAVNALQESYGYDANGIIGDNLISKLADELSMHIEE